MNNFNSSKNNNSNNKDLKYEDLTKIYCESKKNGFAFVPIEDVLKPVEELKEKVAEQERTITELVEIVSAQNKKIEELRQAILELADSDLRKGEVI